MTTRAINLFDQITSATQYPSTSGIRFGLVSQKDATFRPLKLARIDLALGGTLGSGSPHATVQAQLQDGSWVNTPITLTATGQMSGHAEGVAFRVDADPGSTPGTGVNTPRYALAINETYLINMGETTHA